MNKTCGCKCSNHKNLTIGDVVISNDGLRGRVTNPGPYGDEAYQVQYGINANDRECIDANGKALFNKRVWEKE